MAASSSTTVSRHFILPQGLPVHCSHRLQSAIDLGYWDTNLQKLQTICEQSTWNPELSKKVLRDKYCLLARAPLSSLSRDLTALICSIQGACRIQKGEPGFHPLADLLNEDELREVYTASSLKTVLTQMGAWGEGDLRPFFQQVVQPLYKAYPLPLSKKTIVVAGDVYSDGFGDFAHICNVFELLLDKYPHWTVQSLCRIDSLDKRAVNIDRFLEGRPRPTLIDSSDRSSPLLQIFGMTQTDRQLKGADLVLMVSTTGILWKKPEEKTLYLTEYGHPGAPPFTAMGASPNSLGLFIKNPVKKGIRELSSHAHALKTLLLGNAHSEENEAIYHQKTELVYGYLKSEKVERAFMLANCHAFSKSDKSLDLIGPYPYSLISENLEALQNCGFMRIEHYGKNGEDLILTQAHGTEGRTLRVINPGFLPNNDVQILTAQSSLSSGCGGDASFSEALSFRKLPFYNIYYFKAIFFRSFIALAKECLGQQDDLPLIRYFNALCAINKKGTDIPSLAKELGDLMRNPKTLEQLNLFCDFLQQHYNANLLTLYMINRHMTHQDYPRLKDLEERTFSEFASGKKSLAESYTAIEQELQREQDQPTTSSCSIQ